MKRHFTVEFEHQDDILDAVREYRASGFEIEDAFTPYAVHGLDDAAGIRRSRLGYFCGIVGLSAAALGLYFQYWVSAVDWPLNIGGKPLASIPAFIPVTFEIGVLVAGLSTVGAFFVASRLFPGKRPPAVSSRTTSDRFALTVSASSPDFDAEVAQAIARRHRAVESRLERRSEARLGRGIESDDPAGRRGRLNLLLAGLFALLVVLNFAIVPRSEQRGTEFLPEMIQPVAAESYAGTTALPNGQVLQAPPAGTISRGRNPLTTASLESVAYRLEPGPEGAATAAARLTNPLLLESDTDVDRGREVYAAFCQLCHGAGGLGDGLVAGRGFPAPPSLLASEARSMADGQLFHVISMGQGNMPAHRSQLDPVDRWRAVLWVRHLQASAPADPDPGNIAGREETLE